MKIKWLFFEFFFLDFQLNSSTQILFNSKSIVQKLSTNGGQSHRPMLKKLLFPTLNANIFQSIQSNFMNFLSHDLIQDFMVIFKKKVFFGFFG